MLHGDIGIVRPKDTIIYISNSGNTEELISVAQYVHERLGVCQICITTNPSARLSSYVDHSLVLCNFKIKEADTLDMAPTVSCVLFMIVLDVVGLHLAEFQDITKQEFQRNHPAGALGK